MAAISAQDATITLGGVAMSDVVQYEVGVAVTFDSGNFGTVRLQSLSNSAVTTRRRFTQRRRLVISHGGVTTFDGWVFPRAVRVTAVRGDFIRYVFDFEIVSVPYLA